MKILGIDIGTSSIKTALIESRFGRNELLDFHIEPLTSGHEKPQMASLFETASPQASSTETEGESSPEAHSKPVQLPPLISEAQAHALLSVVSQRRDQFDRLCVNLPRNLAATRFLKFPTKDRRAIEKSLEFELEDEVPFELSDAVVEFLMYPHPGSNSSAVFTAFTLKANMDRFLKELTDLGIDPEIVTLESAATSQLVQRILPPAYKNAPLALINIGSSTSVIQFFVGAQPVLTRSMDVGSNALTLALAKHYHLNFSEAEKIKIDNGFILSESQQESASVTPDQVEFSKILSEALFPLMRDLRQALMAFKTQLNTAPSVVYITGGGSLLPNLQVFLEESLGYPVLPLQYSSHLGEKNVRLTQANEALLSVATSLALTGIKTDRTSTLNFRRGLFEKDRSSSINLNEFPLKKIAYSLGTLLTFSGINLYIQKSILSKQVHNQTIDLERSVRQILGTVSSSTIQTYVQVPSQLRSAVEKEIDKVRPIEISSHSNTPTALEILNTLSRAFPKDVVVDVDTFELKKGELVLKGTLAQGSDADRIPKIFNQTQVFSSVGKPSVEQDPQTKKTKFTIQATLKGHQGKSATSSEPTGSKSSAATSAKQ